MTTHLPRRRASYAFWMTWGSPETAADSSSLEFTWSKDFEWYTDASDTRDDILDYFKQQRPKMFTVKDHRMSGHYKLYFRFKFHPENAV